MFDTCVALLFDRCLNSVIVVWKINIDKPFFRGKELNVNLYMVVSLAQDFRCLLVVLVKPL